MELPADPALDAPVWTALGGAHAHLARTHGRARRYLADVAPFAAIEADDADAWADLAALLGPAGTAALPGRPRAPEGWAVERSFAVAQLVEADLEAAGPPPEAGVVRLGPDDVPEALDLVERTRPGPFGPRTMELGAYLGVRREGRLVAMAGERMRPPGWTEVSAVCTDPAWTGRGLGALLVRAVAQLAHDRGERSMLHVLTTNAGALRLYDRLGYIERGRAPFLVVRAPMG